MTIISLSIGILGLIATILGTCLAYISLVNPWVRFEWYLKNARSWEKITLDRHLTIYRHNKYPGFQIITDWDRPVVENFREGWMADFLDMEHNVSYSARIEANGTYIRDELFVSVDGGRGFVPVPRYRLDANSNKYYYDKIQVQLANIICEYPRGYGEDIKGFAASQKIPIQIIEDSTK